MKQEHHEHDWRETMQHHVCEVCDALRWPDGTITADPALSPPHREALAIAAAQAKMDDRLELFLHHPATPEQPEAMEPVDLNEGLAYAVRAALAAVLPASDDGREALAASIRTWIEKNLPERPVEQATAAWPSLNAREQWLRRDLLAALAAAPSPPRDWTALREKVRADEAERERNRCTAWSDPKRVQVQCTLPRHGSDVSHEFDTGEGVHTWDVSWPAPSPPPVPTDDER